jgi:CheY-like chemotaxis protein
VTKHADGRLRGVYVLFVEDDPDTRDIVTDYLRYHGAYVQTARNGWEALASLSGARAEVLVIDYNMPGMTGIELLKHIRALPGENERATPAILFTGSGHLRQAAREAGFSIYLTKPLDPHVLVDEIARLVAT